ncbi:uncharacterized protein LY79DRAFT_536921 [Colletotrichum navitas]|uniref:Uncharacterized protein n=1 Tax=Colletotrichum navitas TaxID=681940 RepID=A0AAD8QD00_9PEZI|nr:uncharacterized protein LY79DRAFT_536921 [Colletotrichum navitas]KAK1599083.1 hypothetical protein LY79DRAFT_536921 [Colletotrichum navitas]
MSLFHHLLTADQGHWGQFPLRPGVWVPTLGVSQWSGDTNDIDGQHVACLYLTTTL